MQDARPSEFNALQASDTRYPVGGDFVGESMDPNEIRIALSELSELMSRIRSSVISQDLRTAYDRIAGINLREWLPQQ
jgi:hypothetical protein